jgi:4-hydroxy-tetrahydrodipicolinate reductase
MTTRIGILGITGRMGQLLVEEVAAAGASLAGGVQRAGSDKPAPAGVTLFADTAALAAASDVVIDFTHASTAQATAAAMAASGTPWVLGTSGLSAADEAAVEAAAARIPVVYASNFSAGVNLVLALAERMGAALPAEAYDAEIMEMHHRQKVDAPSGTAVGMGRAVAKGRGVRLDDVMESGRHGHTGARKTGAIGFAALRGGQVVGEHTLIFASGTEHIALTHRAFDRRAFATGAVRAALWVGGRPAALYSMMDVLGMA